MGEGERVKVQATQNAVILYFRIFLKTPPSTVSTVLGFLLLARAWSNYISENVTAASLHYSNLVPAQQQPHLNLLGQSKSAADKVH